MAKRMEGVEECLVVWCLVQSFESGAKAMLGMVGEQPFGDLFASRRKTASGVLGMCRQN
jgi:hypothetical protein